MVKKRTPSRNGEGITRRDVEVQRARWRLSGVYLVCADDRKQEVYEIKLRNMDILLLIINAFGILCWILLILSN